MAAGLPHTVGFQASLILIQPGGVEPAQTIWVCRMAPNDRGASGKAVASTEFVSRCGSGLFPFAAAAAAAAAAGAGAARASTGAAPAVTSSAALAMAPTLD